MQSLRLSYNLISELIETVPRDMSDKKVYSQGSKKFLCFEQFLICDSLKSLDDIVTFSLENEDEEPFVRASGI